MMPAITPGPWAVTEDGCIVAANGTHVVCLGHDYDDGGMIASVPDEYLIAAAPDMLEALRNIERHCPCDPGSTTIFEMAWETLKAAIAKAEGLASS